MASDPLKTEENSIEEEIEEEIDTPSLSDELSLGASNSGKINVLFQRKRQLFNINPDDEDDLGVAEATNRFDIDENDLSGGKIAAHFEQNEEADSTAHSSRYSEQLEEAKSTAQSDKISQETESSEKSKTSKRYEVKKSDIPEENPSTIYEISDILFNESNPSHLYTRSLEITEKPNSINYEDRRYHSLDKNIELEQLIGQESRELSLAEADSAEAAVIKSDEENQQQDKSIDEILAYNDSIEITLDHHDLSSLDPNIDINNESEINRILQDTQKESMSLVASETSDDVDISVLKERILTYHDVTKQSSLPFQKDLTHQHNLANNSSSSEGVVKQMERVSCEFVNEALDDITEESEKFSGLNNDNEPTSNDFDSVISLNMIQMLEAKVKELQDEITEKNVCLTSLNMQLETANRRESNGTNDGRDSVREQPPSGRDSSSLATSSTEYRTIQEDCGTKVFDFHREITERDNLIEKLTDSLQQSMNIREGLRTQSEKLSTEVCQLRRQLTDTLEALKRPYWPRADQESSGQRLSEISIELVSESDDDLDRNFLTDNEDKFSTSNRNSRERCSTDPLAIYELSDPVGFNISKQVEQFQKYLSADELRVFFMVQKKFDDFLGQEIEKIKMKYDNELRISNDRLESEKKSRENEVNRLRQLLASVKDGSSELVQLRQELETMHGREMENLRTYFEKKCADLEKNYSEDVFSQKSQRVEGSDTSSDLSDHDNLPEEPVALQSKESSPRKRARELLYSSPTHRQMTPTTLSQNVTEAAVIKKGQEKEIQISVEELKDFYQEKIRDIKKNHTEEIRRMNEKIKFYESKYADDDFLFKNKNAKKTDVDGDLLANKDTSSNMIIGQDETVNDGQEIHKIVAEYERRLNEQITLARQDIIHELDVQIQALLSETTPDDHHWPPELVLLREKFTAKSQLEIAQLQIKHEEEMSRLKSEFEKQLSRKLKRNSTFDLNRDLEQIVGERENLRELSNAFRWLLSELAKCVSFCEEDLNSSLLDQLLRHGYETQQQQDQQETKENSFFDMTKETLNDSNVSVSRKIRFAPDVSGILSLIDDPSLIEFIEHKGLSPHQFHLSDCLEKLKSEANHLLELSENLYKKRLAGCSENGDSCEEEDGLKSASKRSPQKIPRQASLNENLLRDKSCIMTSNVLFSLPTDISRLPPNNESLNLQEDGQPSSGGPTSELNFQVHELRNRFVKSESERKKLQQDLEISAKKIVELTVELNALKEHVCAATQKEVFCESYGIEQLKSPPRNQQNEKTAELTSFTQLQDKARLVLSSPIKSMGDNSGILMQLIEEFCREGDKFVEDGKRDREDLQAQIDAADKQLKATRQFLEDQAAERELERDDFQKEIEKLKCVIRDKEKERTSYENASKEICKILNLKVYVEQMEQQINSLTKQSKDFQEKKLKLETELKASIDKIFVLREIISELETQIESKSLNEHVLNEKVKELEMYISSQNRLNETLQQEIESLKTEMGHGYQNKITQLEELLRNSRPSAEQNSVLNKIIEQLRDIETVLEQKTKGLESLHQAVGSSSCSTSPYEDVSVDAPVQALIVPSDTPQSSPIHAAMRLDAMPIDELQRIFEKLSKHTRVEEAAIKRIHDLEMQMQNCRTGFGELQHERDVLQERMSEQLVRISSLQSKLDEQRHRAEDLQRQGTSELAIRIHDLQSEVQNLKETLSVRDKQILNLKNHLDQTKTVIDRQDAELALGIQGDRDLIEKLEFEVKSKSEENRKLKEKIKNEMINKLALPDLMETMLADKNEEIDHLKDQLQNKDRELQGILELNLSEIHDSPRAGKDKFLEDADGGKNSGRTLSDIVSFSEYDEPDIIRKVAEPLDTALTFPNSGTSKAAIANLTERRTADLTNFTAPNSLTMQTFAHPNYFQQPSGSHKDVSSLIPAIPRHINFSEFIDDSNKFKQSTPRSGELRDSDDVIELQMKLQASESNLEILKRRLDELQMEKNSELDRLRTEVAAKNQYLEKLKLEKKNIESEMENASQITKKYEDYRMKCLKNETQLQANTAEILDLKVTISRISSENLSLTKKISNAASLTEKVQNLTEQIDILNKVIKEKDEVLSKHEKNFLNYQKNEIELRQRIFELETTRKPNQEVVSLQHELDAVRQELTEKVFLYEKSLLDIKEYQNLPETGSSCEIIKLKQKIMEELAKNSDLQKRITYLEGELERLRSQNSDNSKPFSLDEIAEQVEKELNYSAQLDSNILKAIESEEENDLAVQRKGPTNNEDGGQIQSLHQQLQFERDKWNRIQEDLQKEKQKSQDIQQQDADMIEAMRLRLEAALDTEQQLQRILDEEREKCERLATQVSVFQRSEARKAGLLLKSPPGTPRRSPRSSDAESDSAAERLKNEIKLLSAQNEREKERSLDLQRSLEREKNRFETELRDRIDYCEKLKKEMEKGLHEKECAEEEAQHLLERLSLSTREIESLEARISTFQEAETRRAQRRGRERTESTQHVVDMQEVKTKVAALTLERDHLAQLVAMLRSDIERGAQREVKLAEALSHASAADSPIPDQFMQKLKELSRLLLENKNENHQMADTLQYLTEERKVLQKKCDTFEAYSHDLGIMAANFTEMEERANHLFGKYLRVESHRKALVHQKRYLLIVLQTYEENENKALALLSFAGGGNEHKRTKPKSFKSAALVIVAIQRMKFIVKRWNAGKRIATKSIFKLTPTIRSPPSTALPVAQHFWSQPPDSDGTISAPSASPPCRDKPPALIRPPNRLDALFKPLQSPGLIAECKEKFDPNNPRRSKT